MVQGILDIADHVTLRGAPARHGRVDIDSPAFGAMQTEQRRVVLGVLPTTDEQHLAAVKRGSGDQLALQIDAIWKTANQKLAVPHSDAVTDARRQ